MKILSENNKLCDFDGIRKTEHQRYYVIKFSNGTMLKTSVNHRFKTADGRFVEAQFIGPDAELLLADGTTTKLESIEIVEQPISLYDPINVRETNTYISNGIVSHNCQFLSAEKTLINPIILNKIEPVPREQVKIIDNGINVFRKLKKDEIYFIAVDPATGVDGDFTVIEVISIPSFEEVIQWRSNVDNTPEVYSVLRHLITLLEKNVKNDIYFTIENNGVGEGLISSYLQDPNPPERALLVSEKKRSSKRKGMYTTPASKQRAEVLLKNLIEHSRLKINSEITKMELKTYILKGKKYQAQYGSTDDCISALLLVVRMMDVLSSSYPEIYEALYGYISDDISDDVDSLFEADENGKMQSEDYQFFPKVIV